MVQINKVLLSAGIHGNEKTGIYLIKKFQKNKKLILRNSLVTETLLVNPKAIELNQRYYEVDLNRCFELKNFNNHKSYEQDLAQQTYQQLRQSQIDFVLDFHTSTANMGLTLLLSNDNLFNLQLAAYLIAIDPSIKIVRTADGKEKNRFRNIFPFGFTVEMGAIAPNVIDPIWFRRAEILVEQILDYLDKTNNNQQPTSSATIPVYSMFETIYFPTDSQKDIAGIVSGNLHGNDYGALNPGEVLFNKFDGEDILYPGDETVYPIFVNEAAYWEDKIAMYLTTKENISLLDSRS